MHKNQKLLFLSIVALLFFILPVAQAAAEPKLEIRSTAGFDNKGKNGQGLPLTINVTNNGDAFSGDLVIDYAESYATGSALVLPIEIGSGETKTLDVSLSGFSDQYMYNSSNFQMFHFYEDGWEHGKSLDYKGDKSVKINMFDPTTYFIVTLSNSADRVKAITNVNVPSGPFGAGKQIIHLGQMKDFIFPSDQEAWSAADYMIIDEYVLSDLSEKQQEAILGWIRNGGIAIIGASENTVAEVGLLGGYLPLTLSTERITVVPEFFTEHSNGSKFNEVISIFDAEIAQDSQPILVGPDSVIAASKAVGSGTIVQTAFSIGDEPLSTQPGYANFLSELLKKVSTPNINTNYTNGQSVMETMSWQIGNVNELFPSFKINTPIIIGIIVIYILLVSPLMYFLLKRKDKREHAWWIIPAVSVITSVGIFAYGAKDRIVKPQIQQTSLLEVNEDGSLSGYYMESILSNRSGEFSFVAPKDTTMTASLRSNFGMISDGSFQKAVLERGANQSTLTLRNVGYWSVNSIMGQTFIPDAGKLEVDLKVENEYVTGTITNGFPFSLKELSIWAGSKFIDLGELAPNATLEVNENLGSAIMPPAGTGNSINTYGHQYPSKAEHLIEARKTSALGLSEAIMGPSGEPAIVAYTEDAIIPVELEEQRADRSAVNVIVQTFKPETILSTDFILPATTLIHELTPVQGSSSHYEPVDGGRFEWFLEEGDYTMKWNVPEDLPMGGVKWTELQVVNRASNSITVQIKNVKKNEYEDVPDGKRLTIEENVQDYITAEGTIELLIHKDMANGDTHTKVPEVRLKGAVQ